MAVVDLDVYKISKEQIQTTYLNNLHRGDSISVTVSFLAANPPFTPCIAIAYFIGEVANWSPEAIACIESQMKFYRYEGVINKPPGCPI